MLILKRCILSAAALTVSASAIAALPDPGLWAIDGEMNGKPGRGIQIDRQGGETVIASYYGYRSDGTAVFYQAVGKITDGKTFNAPLIEYKGGTVIGGAVKDATEAKTIGPMQAVFNTDSSGSVTLPGSESKTFTRYVYEDHRQRLNNTFQVWSISDDAYESPPIDSRLTLKLVGNQLQALDTRSSPDCYFLGELVADGGRFSSSGAPVCDSGIATPSPVPRFDRYENLKVDDKGVLTGVFRSGTSPDNLVQKSILVGQCIVEDEIVTIGPAPARPCPPSRLGLSAMPD